MTAAKKAADDLQRADQRQAVAECAHTWTAVVVHHRLAKHHACVTSRLFAGKLGGETARADAAEARFAAVTSTHQDTVLELNNVRKASRGEIAQYDTVHQALLLPSGFKLQPSVFLTDRAD